MPQVCSACQTENNDIVSKCVECGNPLRIENNKESYQNIQVVEDLRNLDRKVSFRVSRNGILRLSVELIAAMILAGGGIVVSVWIFIQIESTSPTYSFMIVVMFLWIVCLAGIILFYVFKLIEGLMTTITLDRNSLTLRSFSISFIFSKTIEWQTLDNLTFNYEYPKQDRSYRSFLLRSILMRPPPEAHKTLTHMIFVSKDKSQLKFKLKPFQEDQRDAIRQILTGISQKYHITI